VMVSISCPAATIKHFSLSGEHRAARACKREREREREGSALVTLGSPGDSALFRSFIRSLYSILLVRLCRSLRGFLRLRVRAHPHEDRAPRWRARSESRSRARQRSVCEQVQARCILCIPAGSRSHPASHVSPCSASVRACPSFFLLLFFSPLGLAVLGVPHDAVFRARALSLSLSFFDFRARCKRAFSTKTYNFRPREPAIVLFDAADDRKRNRTLRSLGVDDKARARARLYAMRY